MEMQLLLLTWLILLIYEMSNLDILLVLIWTKCKILIQFLVLICYLNKCKIYAESKLTKKSCSSIQKEAKLLSLIYIDVGDLKKKIMTRSSKKILYNFYWWLF